MIFENMNEYRELCKELGLFNKRQLYEKGLKPAENVEPEIYYLKTKNGRKKLCFYYEKDTVKINKRSFYTTVKKIEQSNINLVQALNAVDLKIEELSKKNKISAEEDITLRSLRNIQRKVLKKALSINMMVVAGGYVDKKTDEYICFKSDNDKVDYAVLRNETEMDMPSKKILKQQINNALPKRTKLDLKTATNLLNRFYNDRA